MQKTIIQGLVSGLLSAIACLIYSEIYTAATGADFSSVINIFPVMATCLLGSVMAAIGSWVLSKFISNENTHEVMFNIIFIFLTFISCIYPLSQQLPYEEFDSPQLFNGLVIPMHFFPCMFWISLNPIFKRSL